MPLDSYEEKRRNFEMSSIKKEHLLEMGLNAGYTGSKTKKKEISEFLLTLDTEIFDKVSRDYIDAGQTTNYIFTINEEIIKKIKKDIKKDIKQLANYPSDDFDNFFLEDSYYDNQKKEYNIRLNRIKRTPISVWNSEKNETGYHYEDKIERTVIIIWFEENKIIIRTQSFLRAKGALKELFLNQHKKIIPFFFSKEGIINIVTYMTILRGANLRYETDDEIQSAIFSAGAAEKDGILKNLKKSPKFRKAWDEGELRNCKFSNAKNIHVNKDNLKREDVITLGINFIESKIYFITRLSEIETKKWILKILKSIKLKVKPKKDYWKEFL